MATYLRGGIYWYRFQAQGREYRGSCRTRDKREAKQVEAEARLKVAATKAPTRRIGTLEEAMHLDLVRKVEECKVSPGYLAAVRHFWVSLAFVLGDVPLASLTAEHIRRYRLQRLKTVKLRTVKEEIDALGRGFDLLAIPRPQPWPVFKLKREGLDEKRAGRLVPDSELEAFFSRLKGGPLNFALIALSTGMRKAEIKRLSRTFVDAEGRAHLPSEATKTKVARMVPLGSVGGAAFARQTLATGSATPFANADPNSSYQRVCKAMGLKRGIHLRDLRHTFASWAHQLSNDSRAVDMVMGHAVQTMSDRYHTASRERLDAVGAQVAQKLAQLNWHSEKTVSKIGNLKR